MIKYAQPENKHTMWHLITPITQTSLDIRLGPKPSARQQGRLRSGWMDAQTESSVRWAQTPHY